MSELETIDPPATLAESERQLSRPPGGGGGWLRTPVALLIPVALLVAIAIAVSGNSDRILGGFGHNPPPADELVVEAIEFHPGTIEVRVVNPQADAITPVMVTVDGAIVNEFEIEGGDAEIGAREQRTLVIPFPWITDDPYAIMMLSSSGVPTEAEAPAAVPAEGVTAGGLGWGAVIGLLVGFVPVLLGLAWLPALRQLSPPVIAGFLAFTGGLLAFLAVDAAAEAFETQGGLIPAVGGAGLVVMGIVVSMVALSVVGRLLRNGVAVTRRVSSGAVLTGGALAMLVAVGIGLHNLGEGLAIGSSFATGEASLAIALIIGFMIHNLTEGIGIAAPLARTGALLRARRGLLLAAVAGVPAVFGIWAGRYFGGPLFITLCFSIAAGAALQVVIEIVRSLQRSSTGLTSLHVQVGFAAGILVMWGTGILAG